MVLWLLTLHFVDDAYVGRHGRDEADQFVGLGYPDASVPLLDPAGGLQRPGQELRTVEKSSQL